MHQVEIIMYVTLGFATASLIALFLGRLAWRYALSLGRRRTQRSTPSAVAELLSDRDRLRAEYAMLARKLELRLEDLKTKLAEQMAEISRNRNRIDHLSETLREREATLAERDAELARLKEQLAHFETELASRTQNLQQVTDQLREREEGHATLARELETARQALAERDQQIQRLRGDLEHFATADPQEIAQGLTAQERLRQRIEDLTGLSRQIEEQRRQLVAQQTEYKSLRESMAEQQTRPRPPAAAEAELAGTSERPAAVGEAAREQQSRIEAQTLSLERQIEEAERETAELQGEIERLDARWTAMLSKAATAESEAAAEEPVDGTPAPKPEQVPAGAQGEEAPGNSVIPAADKKTVPGLANVISLANRIRALQRDIRR